MCRRRKRAQHKKSLDAQRDTTTSESKDKQPFSRKFLKWLISLHLYAFKKALRDELGVTRIEHLFNKEDCDFRSIGMNEEEVEVVMTEVMKRLQARVGETSETTPPHLGKDDPRGLAVCKVGLRASDHSDSADDHKATSQDRYELLEARNASLSQQVTDLKEANKRASIGFETALQEERDKFLEMQRENAKLKQLIADNTSKARDEESRLSLEIKTLQTELREVITAHSGMKSRSDLLEARNASLSQQVADLKQASKDAKAQ